jgi:hypothetical protein
MKKFSRSMLFAVVFMLSLACAAVLQAQESKNATPFEATTPLEAELLKLQEEGYFQVRAGNETGRYGPVLILPEYHRIPMIQMEFAYALDRLASAYGLNTIAREGMFAGNDFNTVQLPDNDHKADILLDFLEIGTIDATEYLHLLKNFHVFGIEDEKEYNHTVPQEVESIYKIYLYADLLQEIGLKTTFETWGRNPLKLTRKARERYAQYMYLSSEEEITMLNNWKEKHRSLLALAGENVQEIENHCNEYIAYINMAGARSRTMARNVKTELYSFRSEFIKKGIANIRTDMIYLIENMN